MAYTAQIERYGKPIMITGVPGVGYERVMDELMTMKDPNYFEKIDHLGFRYTTVKPDTWYYDISKVYDKIFDRRNQVIYSLGGDNVHQVMFLPWSYIFILNASPELILRSTNEWRSVKGFPALQEDFIQRIILSYEVITRASKFTKAKVVSIEIANRTAKEIATEILRFLDDRKFLWPEIDETLIVADTSGNSEQSTGDMLESKGNINGESIHEQSSNDAHITENSVIVTGEKPELAKNGDENETGTN